jgi:hypothetical protein
MHNPVSVEPGLKDGILLEAEIKITGVCQDGQIDEEAVFVLGFPQGHHTSVVALQTSALAHAALAKQHIALFGRESLER